MSALLGLIPVAAVAAYDCYCLGSKINSYLQIRDSSLSSSKLKSHLKNLCDTRLRIIKYLLPEGYKELGESWTLENLFKLAAQTNMCWIVRPLFELGGEIHGSTAALVFAVAMASNETAMEIIQNSTCGCLLDAQDKNPAWQNSALHLAVAKGYTDRAATGENLIVSNLELVKALIAKGANVNLRNAEGFTPLHYAYLRHDLDMIRELQEVEKVDQTIVDDVFKKTPSEMWWVSEEDALETLRRATGNDPAFPDLFVLKR